MLFWVLSIACTTTFDGQATSSQRISPIVSASGTEAAIWVVTATGELVRVDKSGVAEIGSKLSEPRRVYFLDSRNGWVIDALGGVWSTNDSGEKWQKIGRVGDSADTHSVDGPMTGYAASQIVFADEINGWINGPWSIWNTSDGGHTWIQVYPTANANYASLSAQPLILFAVREGTAWLGMSNGRMLRTANSGSSWEEASLPVDTDIRAIHAETDLRCTVGVSGGLYSTADGGKTWKENFFAQEQNNLVISSISFPSTNYGWFTALRLTDDVTENPTEAIFATTDGGSKWTEIMHNFPAREIRYLKFVDERTGWLSTRDTVYLTADGGKQWLKLKEIQ